MFGMIISQRAQANAAHEAARHNANRQMSASAYALWQEHGDRYAGMDSNGNAILWRATTIPKSGRSVAG